MVIQGGGYIAVEFASIFSGLGVATTLVHRGDMILRGFDEDLRRQAEKNLAARGVTVITSTTLAGIQKISDGLRVTLSDGRSLAAGGALLAIGRTPNTHGLGLEQVGVTRTSNGAIAVDAFSRTSVANIWAVGDVTDRIALTPVAIREGHAFADTVFGGRETRFDHEDVANAVFAIPPIASVGLSEAAAKEKFGAAHVYKAEFRPMKAILASDQTRMFMKLVVEPGTERVAGVHIAGPDAPEMIQLAAIAVKAGLTKAQWDATCAVHPTAAEELVLMRERAN
jgi:glutathione reductase (NADPH)